MVASRTGYLLTRQQRDRPEGIELSYWLASPDGAFQVSITGQEAIFFIRAEQAIDVRHALAGISGWRLAPLSLSDLEHRPVQGLYCRTLQVRRRCIERLKQSGLAMMEEDIRQCDRYLMERFIQGAVSVHFFPEGPLLRPVSGDAESHFAPVSHNTPVSAASKAYDVQVALQPAFRVLSIDIETTLRADRIHSIALYADDYQRVLMRGEGCSDAHVHYLPDETALLMALVLAVREYDPDIFIGWNVVGFDFRVLVERARILSVPLLLGRDGGPLRVHQVSNGMWFARMSGRVVLDGIDTLKGATWHFDRYSLEYVSRQLLGRGKLVDHVDLRGESIQQLFREDKAALARYNLEDCRLVWDIFEQAQLLPYLIERSNLTGLALDKVGGSATAFDNQYLPRLHRAGYVAPEYASGRSGLSAPGGYVMDSVPGLYRHVLVLDFKSLYPSIIRTFCIDPMGLAEGLSDECPDADKVPGFNQAIFSSQQHILPGLIKQLWLARDRAREAEHRALSTAIKIIMNSFYGVLGSNVCRFFDQRLSSSITLRGHQILLQTREEIERHFGYRVIYGDTDSVFVWLGEDASDETAEQCGQQLQNYLNSWWQRQIAQRFGLPSYLELEYEAHYSRFLMPTMRHSEKGTKKRYAGLQCFPDGRTKVLFKGLENVRTDWTDVARNLQERLYEAVFRDQPWQALITETVQKIYAGELDDQLIYRRRLRQPVSEYTRNRPPHVQAAAKANILSRNQGLPEPCLPGQPVAYIMTINGAEPVDYQTSLIDYQHYIDRQIQPVVDTIARFLEADFEQLVAPQIDLF
ncbi:MAG: DNA polymerase II [Marinobacterium sp.]|nr:DNA polymerase II [Marinobacterium sp.]